MIESWLELMKVINGMDEVALQSAINLEVSTYRRKAIITRLHQRFTKLRSQREREALIAGKSLL